MEAANDNWDLEDSMSIPEEYLAEVALRLRDLEAPHLTVGQMLWRHLRALRAARLREDEVWTVIIDALEWIATIPPKQKHELLTECQQFIRVA